MARITVTDNEGTIIEAWTTEPPDENGQPIDDEDPGSAGFYTCLGSFDIDHPSDWRYLSGAIRERVKQAINRED
tara:strand:+ start:580 stop:801 length:222 start_codon:yes stop_codon:yes gene_type:complete